MVHSSWLVCTISSTNVSLQSQKGENWPRLKCEMEQGVTSQRILLCYNYIGTKKFLFQPLDQVCKFKFRQKLKVLSTANDALRHY